jgi:tetraacyldisaccharide 4'-kinase
MNPFASLILPPLSAIYGGVTRARAAAYRRGWFSVSKLDAPVVSVGNLTTGGTGKTPLVEWVCRTIAAETGKSICVLTRGYGRADPRTQVVVSDGNKLLANEREAGDEPFLLAGNLIGIAAVISNPDRTAAGEWAIEHLRSEVFVLDDGFQHLRLARDLDIVTVDATNPWGDGGGHLLPYGRLREPRTSLARAGSIVITRMEQAENPAATKNAVQELAGGIPIFTSQMMISGTRNLTSENIEAKNEPKNPVAQTIAAFCGVGNPASFFNQLRREGYQLAFTRAFPDHHNYNQTDVTRLVNDAKASGAAALFTTAKDAIKLASLEFELPCYVLNIQISIDDAAALVEIIRNACSNREG